MYAYGPLRPKRSDPFGTATDSEKSSVPVWFCASAAGSVTFSAVQPTSSAPAVPPVRLVILIGWFDGQLPW
jgi:hypothetical protein